MLRKVIISCSLFVVLFAFSSANAQYTLGRNYLGPTIGFSFLGSTPQFGVNFEHSMKLEDFGNVGIGGVFRYWSYSETAYNSYKWSYTNILIGAQGNYHFVVTNDKFDPWAGIVIAYDAGSASWDGPGGFNYVTPSYGGFFIGAQGGVRYWFQPNLGLVGRIAFGSLSYGGLEVGVDFKF